MIAEAVPYEDFWFHDGPWTEEDYLRIPPGGPKIELVDGRLVVSPAPRQAHQRLMRRLANLLEAQAPDDLAVEVELNVRIGPEKILIPDVVATYEQGDDVLVHHPAEILLVVEVLSPSNKGQDWVYKNHLYSVARIPWYLLVEVDENDERPTLILQRLGSGHYNEVARATCGETLQLPDPFGEVDPADLLKRRP
ncbi:Uma2 family endonuclease [Actinoallomurus sp. NPDC052274]|uniref:Uma2 family endonuclease n=1 Tax=Actinoallomurus sp. NPDC052274 TaxID=3155420 RepID=UPI003447DFFA